MFVRSLTFFVMLSVGASSLTLLHEPTNTAAEAVAMMLALAGIGRKAGARLRNRSSRCDLGAGSASSCPSTWDGASAAAFLLLLLLLPGEALDAAVVTAMLSL